MVELLMPKGEKIEKEGTLLMDVSQQEKNLDLEILEQIDGKLDLLLGAEKTRMEGKV